MTWRRKVGPDARQGPLPEGDVMEPKPSFDPQVPSIARTYDYLLGGKDNYPVDREIGEIFVRKFPGAVQIALDNDPIVLAHGRAMLAEDEFTVVVRADIRQPAQILSDPAVRGLIDFRR